MKNKILLLHLLFFLYLFHPCFGEKTISQYTEKDLVSRFILTTDNKKEIFANITLPSSWWSHSYEYLWAEKFAGPTDIVLDGACGIQHPFKWLLAEKCNLAFACDINNTILDFDKILSTYDENILKKAYKNIPQWKKINLLCASICNLPTSLPQFDRIFCISTLEHMSHINQKKALAEFAKKLKKNGLIIITFDYPTVIPEELFILAESVGLESASEKELGPPPLNALNGYPYYPYLYVYRCVLKHKK